MQSTNSWGGTNAELHVAVADSCWQNCFQQECSHAFYQGSVKLLLPFTGLISNLSIY